MSMFLVLIIMLILLINIHKSETAFQRYEYTPRQCGYDSCAKPKPDMLNVHVVAHTHNDVGWRKTVDQYFFGTKMNLQKASVQTILDSVIQSLLKDPNRRFIYVESVYFFMWWDRQTQKLRKQVKQLVNEGRLEFIGGAWSMNDEAVTHYQSTIDQFTLGLGKLNDTFGECGRPKIGWQIDPFSHSREFASLLTQMGYDGLFIGRIDYEDKLNRLSSKNMEMVWHTSDSLGSKADLFTGVLYNLYNPPPEFCFDILCQDDPIVDDPTSPEYNLDKKLQVFYDFIEQQANVSLTNNIILTMGRDFSFMNANFYFDNLDRLIRKINERQQNGLKVNVFYSTPSCYLKALRDSNVSWPTKKDDFVPTASKPKKFWTGYFSSRPNLKRFERYGNHFLQVCKQLSALTKRKPLKLQENLNNMREAMGISQHHDATSDAIRQYVASDYARRIQIGVDKCSENIKESLNQLSISKNISRDEFNPIFRFEYKSCAKLNISACEVSETSEKFMVTLYNPLAHSTAFQYVRVPVTDGEYDVLDPKNGVMNTQLVPIPNKVKTLSFRKSASVSELVFRAYRVPPLGYKSYFIQRKSNAKSIKNTEIGQKPFTIGNEHLNLTFDENGLLQSAATKEVQMKVRQNFYFYTAADENQIQSENESCKDACVFQPNEVDANEIVAHAHVQVITGDLVDEVHQTFNEWISQVIRIYKNENYAEFQWLVGPIPIGYEIISKFNTDIESNDIFYTDSNSRQMMKRRRNYRETWNITLSEEVAGNYYPFTAKIAIEDTNRRFAILNDRPQGGGSLKSGSIEFMINRRIRQNDFKSGDSSNEDEMIVRGSNYFVLSSKKYTEKTSSDPNERFIQLKTLLPNLLLFSNVSQLSYNVWKDSYKNIYSGLSLSLPKNIHLLTFEPWKAESILIRFEHILAKDEDNQYSQAVTFNFQDVFRSFDVVSIRETTLSANQWLNETKRLHFQGKTEDFNALNSTAETFTSEAPEQEKVQAKLNINPDISPRQYYKRANRLTHHRAIENDENDLTITLKPMEIRSFIVELEWRP